MTSDGKVGRSKTRFFSVRRKWKMLQYATWTLSAVLLVMAAALPAGIEKDRSAVVRAADALAPGLPSTAGKAEGYLSRPGGGRTPVAYVLFRGSKAAARGVLGGWKGRGVEKTESALEGEGQGIGALPAEPSPVRFLALEGMPLWEVSFPLRDGRLVLYRPLDWAVVYSWTLAFGILLWIALAIPLVVRALGVKLVTLPSLFRKQFILYTAVCLIPIAFLCLFFVAAAAAQDVGVRWFPTAWALPGWTAAFLALTAWAVYCAVQDFNHRVNDALLVITNGMEMAAKLDFDAPIVAPSRDEIGLVSEIFNQVTHMLKTRVYVLQALFNNVRVFSGLLDEERLLNHTLKTFKKLEEVEEIVVAMRDENTGEMAVRKSFSGRAEIEGMRFSPDEGVLGRLVKNPELTTYTGDEYGEVFRACEKEKSLWGRPDFVMAVPLAYKGMLTGAIVFYNMNFAVQLELKKDYIQGLSNQIAIFLENARLYQMVIRDRLTGLFVHNFVEAQLENLLAQAKRYKFPVSFIMFDVDKFKGINDQYGHAAGNRLLNAVAGVMRSVSRDADLPARYGGDEFEIVLPHTDKEGGRTYAEKLRKAVAAVELEVAPGVLAHVTISVGLATYPDDVETAAQLQLAADSALYGAKALGRNCLVLYRPGAFAGQ